MNLNTAFMRTMHRFKRLNIEGAFAGVRRGEFFTLEILAAHHRQKPDATGVYVSELAEQLEMSLPAVSRMLRALEAKGLVERTVDSADRRNTYISLTEEGAHLQRQGCVLMHRFMQRVVREMGEDNMRTLLALVNRLGDVMEEVAKKTDEGEP